MPDTRLPGYKTEDQLKAEAKARREAEAELEKNNPKTWARQKRENFWYHYKWHTVIGLFVVVIAAVFISDIFFRVSPDATIILVSKNYISDESVGRLTESLKRETDGAVIMVDNIILSEDTGGYGDSMKLVTVLAAGIDPLYLLDMEAFNYISSMGAGEEVFMPESVPADRLVPEFEGMRFYLRNMNPSGEKAEEYYKYCTQLMKLIEGNRNNGQG